ncbi:hypothetical protein [Chromobacterium sp. Panama]|uniref:hypothetical protein n=1 Tax=Chromobacterium sp. Panama TaxID=2161826 RepID=UPI0011B22B84|nr:hypothetical protein [Chromobacterium sp. Panama]
MRENKHHADFLQQAFEFTYSENVAATHFEEVSSPSNVVFICSYKDKKHKIHSIDPDSIEITHRLHQLAAELKW